MNTPIIVYYGLSRLQLQTLKCHFPIRYKFLQINEDFFDSEKNIQKLVSTEGCAFVNPQKLSTEQLQDILLLHEYAQHHTHATILLFVKPLTMVQKKHIDSKNLQYVNLTRGRDSKLLSIVKRMAKSTTPCSENFDTMKSNMFNDGWYFIDFETTGIDPLKDEIISFSISYMADYKIESTTTYYIKSNNKITDNITDLTGITNEMTETGITKTELVHLIKNLPSPSPLIVYSESYFIPFLKALYMSCGETFDIPYVAMDELSAHIFGYVDYKSLYDILPEIETNLNIQSNNSNVYIDNLYKLSLVAFENLQNRYQIRAMGEIKKLY